MLGSWFDSLRYTFSEVKAWKDLDITLALAASRSMLAASLAIKAEEHILHACI